MKEPQKIFLNALNCIPGVGYVTLKNIVDYFKGDFEAAFSSSESQLRAAGIKNAELAAILNGRSKINPEKEWSKLEKEGVRMIVFDEPEYPRLLKEIPHAPIFLYVKGQLKPQDEFSFGVVGTRLATDYGKESAYTIAAKLAQAGLTIVSGLCYGIDAEAHKGVLAVSGRTIAIVASGLSEKNLYPQRNIGLSRRIVENGALISEYPFESPTDKGKLSQRNRIISGLSRGVLIVEAPLRSGALITARYALDQNREVFAIPGNIFSRMSFGSNLLIKQGAHLVTRVEDILQELNIKYEFSDKRINADNEIEERVLDILETASGPRHMDEVARESGLSVSRISIVLTAMTMKGMIKDLGSGKFAVSKMVEETNEELKDLNFRKSEQK